MSENKRKITAALVGDPNTGKSTFFNAWTGMHQVTGNWPGVTVEKLLGQLTLPGGEELTLVDLPGIYSLHAVSEDEKVASDYARSAEPDIIINVIDAVNLERNLYLTLALAELGKPMVAVLTMTDILQRQGFTVDLAELSKRLGMPVVTSDVHKRAKRLALERAILEALATKQNLPRTVYPESLNQALIKAHREGEPEVLAIHRLEGILPGAEAVIADVEKVLGTTPDVLIADARYDKIAEITAGIVKQVGHARTELGRTLDRFALNRWWTASGVDTTQTGSLKTAADADNVLILADGVIQNRSAEALSLSWDVSATCTYEGQWSFPANVYCEKNGGESFAGTLGILARARLVVACEVPAYLLEEGGAWTLTLNLGTESFAYELLP